MLLSEREARSLCEQALGYVRADDAEVQVESDAQAHLRFAANTFTQNGTREDVSVRITVWIDGQQGSATTNATDAASLRALAEEAQEMARLSPVDREYVPTLGPQRYPRVGGYEERSLRLAPKERAAQLARAIDLCEEEGVVGAGFYRAAGSAAAFLTQNGNFGYHRSTLNSFGMTARTPDGTGSGYFLRNHFDPARLDTDRIAREAIRKGLRSRRPVPLDPGDYTVVLEAQAVADLLSTRLPFDARSAEEGRSAFSAPGGGTRLGERIFDERVNLSSDPTHAELPGAPATGEGVPAERFELVRAGRLENLVSSRFWARRQERAPSPGPVNMIMESSAPPVSVEEMVRGTERGLLVGRFWYIRFLDSRTQTYTGLTRDGVWLIENGRLRYPVRNFRFNESLLELLAAGNLEALGAPERVGSSEAQGRSAQFYPPLKVRRFHFSSVSEAV